MLGKGVCDEEVIARHVGAGRQEGVGRVDDGVEEVGGRGVGEARGVVAVVGSQGEVGEGEWGEEGAGVGVVGGDGAVEEGAGVFRVVTLIW